MPVEQNNQPYSSLRGPQIRRLQQLIEWLRTGRKLTARLAAEALEVSRRTIANDIERLRCLGVPFDYDARRKTYVLTGPFENLPLLPLNRAEWAAFLVARFALEALGDTPHGALLECVADRIAEQLPPTVHIAPDTLSRTIRFAAGPQPRAALAHFEALNTAIDMQRVVHLHYYAIHRDEVTERDVQPYALLSYMGRWYLIAYCRLRRDMRDFRIDRIRQLQVLDEVYALPPDFDLDEYLGPAFGVYKGDRTYAVCVRFSPYQARWIREESWHETQLMHRREDGSLEVRMQVTGLADVARWVLSYGAEAEVISPPILRHRIARESRRLAEVYRDVAGVHAGDGDPGHPDNQSHPKT